MPMDLEPEDRSSEKDREKNRGALAALIAFLLANPFAFVGAAGGLGVMALCGGLMLYPSTPPGAARPAPAKSASLSVRWGGAAGWAHGLMHRVFGWGTPSEGA